MPNALSATISVCQNRVVSQTLSGPTASAALEEFGWRYLLGAVSTSILVESFAQAVKVSEAVASACGNDADRHLRLDVRHDRVEATLMDRVSASVTSRDVELARAITAALSDDGFRTGGAVTTTPASARPVQALELAIDAMDIASIRPFWKAVMAYVDEPGGAGPDDPLVDSVQQGPAIWFQQMDTPRPQRNRVHFDITVSHDEAEGRVAAALAAGGIIVDDSHARSFWVLADSEGNEVCVCTWRDREPE